MIQNKNLSTEPAVQKLKEFANYLVKKKNFQGLDQMTFEMLVEDVYDRLEERANAEILAAIPPEKTPVLDELLKTGTKEQLSDFCEASIPNLQNILAQSLLAFEKTYLG